ncbi:tripartite tricarboxylate transporter TctB family protein [Yaniella halotolerans]|uniref:tripartite tricarboxylate transporter TctB family protein n=1 Tax=Yaniella halotolerans TaxID=225453 RepID=UPI0003B6FDDD|nr:tripartite tricarboxylate transporter TctB family protein [Yaniella halotolerans]
MSPQHVDHRQRNVDSEEVPGVKPLSDGLLSIASIVGGIAVVLYSTTLPTPSGGSFGPGLFPGIVGSLSALFGFVLGVALLAQIMARREDRTSLVGEREALKASERRGRLSSHWWDVAAALGAIGFYILLADVLGFIVTISVIQIGLMIKFGSKIRWSFVIGVISTLILYAVFEQLLLIQLPDGFIG